MTKIISAFILLLFLLSNGKAQTVLIKQTVPEDFSTIDNNSGPNRRTFSYPYMGLGWHIDQISHQNDTLLAPSFFRSYEAKFGTREKLKLNGLLALGMDLEVSIASHRLNTKDTYLQSVLPGNIVKSRYLLYKTGGTGYIQINFKPKRGNQLGSYLDLGLYSNYLFGRRMIEILSNSNSKERTKVTQKKLQDFKKVEFGGLLRYGQNTWAVFAKYRYSNTFSNNTFINLPRLTVGFEYFFGNV